METPDVRHAYTCKSRIQSFLHAGRGVNVFLRTTPNAWVHLFVFFCVVLLGNRVNITSTEWIFLIFAGGLVLTTEAINTAIEININLTSPEYHPFARDTKDVAASAVLIASMTALAIGLFIFIPYLI